MKKSIKSLMFVAVAIAAVVAGFLWNGHIIPSSDSGFVTQAQALIGRPLTPLSYAGVARRTIRR